MKPLRFVGEAMGAYGRALHGRVNRNTHPNGVSEVRRVLQSTPNTLGWPHTWPKSRPRGRETAFGKAYVEPQPQAYSSQPTNLPLTPAVRWWSQTTEPRTTTAAPPGSRTDPGVEKWHLARRRACRNHR
ncbi:MAG: hypothetical protein M1609_14180, partial [Firmicutes bacterium]|nr:hypothetical protein [Bacillota bacterium]